MPFRRGAHTHPVRLDSRTVSPRTNCTGDSVCSEGWAFWEGKHILIPWVSQPSDKRGFYGGCLMINLWIHHLQWLYREWKVRTESRRGYHSASIYQMDKQTNPPEVANRGGTGPVRTYSETARAFSTQPHKCFFWLFPLSWNSTIV